MRLRDWFVPTLREGIPYLLLGAVYIGFIFGLIMGAWINGELR
jgi:hypothetical protein